jgi:hypothetical protein
MAPSVHMVEHAGWQKVVTPLQVTYPCVIGQLRSTATQVLGEVYEQLTVALPPQLAMQAALFMLPLRGEANTAIVTRVKQHARRQTLFMFASSFSHQSL